jgi:hypothetical protein
MSSSNAVCASRFFFFSREWEGSRCIIVLTRSGNRAGVYVATPSFDRRTRFAFSAEKREKKSQERETKFTPPRRLPDPRTPRNRRTRPPPPPRRKRGSASRLGGRSAGRWGAARYARAPRGAARGDEVGRGQTARE